MIVPLDRLKKEYLTAVDGMKKHLMRQSEPNKLTFFGELLAGHSFSPKMVSDIYSNYIGTPFERPPWQQTNPSVKVTGHSNLNMNVLINIPDNREYHLYFQ